MQATTTSSPPRIAVKLRVKWLSPDKRHRIRLMLAWICAVVAVASVAIHGMPYYQLDLAARAHSPLHAELRPSGTTGIRLGLAGLGLFSVLFLYAIRKRVPWINRIGSTRHWLDFHILCGVMAPVVITLHSSFKLRGLAGVSYWIMMAVALSGFIGRYLYAQIPRSLSAAELSRAEIESECEQLTANLHAQNILAVHEVESFLELPSPQQVSSMSLVAALLLMLRLDLMRPFQVSGLRRRFLTTSGCITTFGGLLSSGNRELEGVISAVRAQSWLSAKMLFLVRMQEIFHLWHVIHRPFSYSFVVLVGVHITVAMLFGYY